MGEISSDLESLLSADSLEGESLKMIDKCNLRQQKEQTQSMSTDSTTIPYYKKEVLVKEIETKLSSNRNINTNLIWRDKASSLLYNKDLNVVSDVDDSRELIQPENCFFMNGGPQRSQPVHDKSKRRRSRKEAKFVVHSDLLRSRHKSVSYLEQFKKKIYGINNKIDLSTCSIVGSSLSENNGSLSYISYVTEDSGISTSELDFYEDLMVTPKSKPLYVGTEEQLFSESVASVKSKKTPKQIKEKSLIISTANLIKGSYTNNETNKKSSVEKREAYSNMVKLRNRIKINLQREKEKMNRFNDGNGMKGRLAIAQEESVSNFCIDNSVSIPFSASPEKFAPKAKSKICVREKVTKTLKTRENQKKVHKCEETSKLTILQQRHEKEKNLVDSIRNLVLKT